jgi:anthranilate phosphoribosyltransferase
MPNGAVTLAIDKLASGNDLTEEQAEEVLREIMSDAVDQVQIAGFLIALRTKGETVAELTGLARTMRKLATPVEVDGVLVDTAGTGGGRSTFNVSTTAALVAAAAGCRVAKHGNRSATSRSGSADLLEALGARIDLPAAKVAECIEEIGFGFMFAPAHHQATKYVVPVRRELAVRTIFNFLGPLTNPAGATRQVIGISDRAYMEVMGGALARLGCERALIVSSVDGLDEVSVCGETLVLDVSPQGMRSYEVAPEELGIERARHEEIEGGTPAENAEITRGVLSGQDHGARRALVAVNAGAALLVGGCVDSLIEGVRLAERTIDSGAASDTLERFIARSAELAQEVRV